jgi:hypothetical protein
MNRYLITATTDLFEGTVELLYQYGTLVSISTRDCSMKLATRAAFYQRIPVEEMLLERWFAGTKNLVLVQENYTVTLEDFTREYPYRRNSHLLPDIWKKLPQTEQIQAVEAAKAYRSYCHREAAWYKPKIAAAWLKNKEFLNDWKKL